MNIFVCRDITFIILSIVTMILSFKTISMYMTSTNGEYLYYMIASLISLLTLIMVDSAFGRKIKKDIQRKLVR